MIDQRLFTYIEQELKRGVPNQAIKSALRDAGWPGQAVDEAFVAVQSRNAPPRPEVEIPEDEIEKPLVKPKKTKNAGGRKLPMVAIVSIVAVIVAVLAAVWYFIFIVPEQNSEATDDTPHILKKQNADKGNASSTEENVWPEGMAPGTGDQGTGGGSLVVTPGAESNTPGNTLSGVAATTGGVAGTSNDTKRKEDLEKIATAQKLWFQEKGKYYTCGLAGGDCGGKAYGYPEQIGIYLSNASQDPLIANYAGKKAACGTDYVYCGLNNASYSNFFCYYAKLEGGGYYTVSHAGMAVRKAVPKVFEECGIAD